MSAGKSPNNAFNLHKEQMKSVFLDINRDPIWRRRGILEFLNNKQFNLNFYWEKHPIDGVNYLYSPNYPSRALCRSRLRHQGKWLPEQDRKHFLVNKVREYYTDGVRAIGAME